MVQPFENMVVEHGSVVMRVCRALLGPDDAQDAWSETFVAAMRAYPSIRPESNVRAWLVTIAHNKAVDQVRRSNRTPSPTGDIPENPMWDRQPDEDGDLRAALEALPTKQRGAVVYRYLADLSYADIGMLLESKSQRRGVVPPTASPTYARPTRREPDDDHRHPDRR